MAECLDVNIGGPLEEENVESSSKQAKDVKEIRARIQALKKSVSKGDKKKRKEVSTEISALEREIELMKANSTTMKDDVDQEDSAVGIETLTINENIKQSKSKAKRKRVELREKNDENKARKEKERNDRIAQGTVNEEDTVRYQETATLLSILEPLRLTIKDIAPDGNCLYAAFSDQLKQTMDTEVNVKKLREKCSQYVRTHFNDFIPFITNQDTGDLCTKEEFEHYCSKIEDPSVWGGQIEIVAMSHLYQCPVTVYQTGATPIITGEEYAPDKLLRLSYHKHLYSLGKHYNSVIPKK